MTALEAVSVYLPSARVLGEGGYETRGLYSGGPGFFDPKAEEVLVRAVRELARKAGRKLPDQTSDRRTAARGTPAARRVAPFRGHGSPAAEVRREHGSGKLRRLCPATR